MINQVNNLSTIPSTDVIQLTLTLKMTTAQVVEMSVTINNNSPFQDYVHLTIKLNLHYYYYDDDDDDDDDDYYYYTIGRHMPIYPIYGRTSPADLLSVSNRKT